MVHHFDNNFFSCALTALMQVIDMTAVRCFNCQNACLLAMQAVETEGYGADLPQWKQVIGQNSPAPPMYPPLSSPSRLFRGLPTATKDTTVSQV